MGTLLDLASLVVVPSGYKEDIIYSVVPTDGSGDLDFTRASNATRVNSAGLIEKVRTNIQTHSQDFSNAVWVKSAGATLTHSQTDPNGGTTASRLQMPSGTSNFLAASAIGGLTNGGKYTHSIFMRSNTGSTQSVRILDGVRGAAGGTLTASVTTSWQRFEVVITTASTSAGLQIDNVAGTFANDILIAFAQTEESDFGATPYIPTTTAAVSVGITADIPRLDYTGGGCPSLLLEPQRTNLITFSEQFDNAAWDKTGVTVTANNAVSPDGFTNADLLTADGANSIHDIFQLFAGGTANSVSIFVKKGTARYINVVTNYSSTAFDYVSVVFDLDTLTSNVDQSGDLTSSSVKIEDYGNGWYRLVSNTIAAASTSLYAFYGIVDTANPTRGNRGRVTLTSSATIIAYGAQAELGSYVSSYIPTLGSSVTRLADAASKTGISSLIGATEGTLYGEFTFAGIASTMHLFVSVAGSFGNAVYVQTFGSTGISMQVWSGVVNQVSINSSGLTIGQTVKFAAAYKANDFALYVNGVQAGTDTSGSVPSGLSQVEVGNYAEAGSPFNFNSSIKTAALYPVRLSNSELASLTSL